MKLGDEKYYVQKPLIEYVKDEGEQYGDEKPRYQGWRYIPPDEIAQFRKDITHVILDKIFIKKILSLNTFLSEAEAIEILNQLQRIRPDIEGNFTVWQFLKGLQSVYIQKEKRNRNIRVIDTETIDNNDFHLTEEFIFTNGVSTIKQDIVFFINGIPVIFVEAKAPQTYQGIEVALQQVRRYHEQAPELLAVEQSFVLTHIVQFMYGATWNARVKSLYSWKDETKGNFKKLVKTFFKREQVVKLITDYILFTRRDDLLQKVILRPHQMRAVEKIIQRAESKEKKRGLIWHTQGSGKTYTMIQAAKKLIENPMFENPTVILLVDRNELEAQLFGNIQAVGIAHVTVAQSKEHLQNILKQDTRGLVVSMIHKFEGIEPNINTRENIFVLVDEAHRTTSGNLGNYLMGALPNATYIGFTGTPIDKTSYGKGTFIIFGKDDPPLGYLDKYAIAASIEDGATVPLHYALAPNEFTIDKELLEQEFLQLKEAEGISDVDELNGVLEKAINLKNAIKSDARIKKIAKYIAQHYQEYVEPLGYKAFVVAVDREACALYKQALDLHLPPEYTRVVFSASPNDPDFMKPYYLSEEEEKRIRKDFIDPEKLPKILIVTSKLLTGFDAPVLYCMYLDKPMRDHVLLQTIARVNRPYEDSHGIRKPAGFIVDFIGIFDNLKSALAFDSSDIEGIVHDVEKLKERFKELMKEAKKEYIIPLRALRSHDKKIEWILEKFLDKDARDSFYKFYKELSSIYNIISPDAFLITYVNDFDTLTRIYKITKEAYEPKTSVDRELTTKIKKLVQEHVKQSEIKDALDIYEINETTVQMLEKEKISDTQKVFNLTKSIVQKVTTDANTSPYLISIGERVDRIMELYKEKQLSTQQALEEIKQLIDEINSAQKEQKETGLSGEVFSIYWIIKKEGIENPQAIASDMGNVFSKYPHWKISEHQKRELKQRCIRVFLLKGLDAKKSTELTNRILDYLSRN